MAVICTKCGSTDVLCEALVNPNTEKVVSYHDGAFMYGFCENCKDESVITDTNGVKCDMEISYLKFCKWDSWIQAQETPMLLSLELLLLSNSEMPFRSILRAARTSRSLIAPHAGHTHVRSRNDSPLLMQPHSQVLEEGYHLSILCIVTPYFEATYVSLSIKEE